MAGKLLFGVREIGESYKKRDYVLKILQAGYHIGNNGRLYLHDDFRLVADYTGKLRAVKADGTDRPLGLPSIEYDKYHDRLLLLTSIEEDDSDPPPPSSLGGLLWSLPLADLGKPGKLPQPVMAVSADCPQYRGIYGQSRCPLEFASHKTDGLAVLDDRHVLVVFDDDRVKTTVWQEDGTERLRDPESESGYQVLELD